MLVVCVDNNVSDGLTWYGDVPQVGTIYTVIGEQRSLNPVYNGAKCFLLAEIKNKSSSDEDLGYLQERFRPVRKQPSKQTMERLYKMAHDASDEYCCKVIDQDGDIIDALEVIPYEIVK